MLPSTLPFALICTHSDFESALQALLSVRKFYPSAPIWLCLVDKQVDLGPIRAQLPAQTTVVLAQDIGIIHWLSVAFQYTAQELCAAVKPWFMRYVLEQSKEQAVVFLGNQAHLSAPIDVAWNQLGSNEILLIPMNAKPTDPFDPVIEKRPLREGIYNSSFLIVKNAPEGLDMLDWWKERALQEFWNRPVTGYFLDQKWLNFVPRYWLKTCMIDSASFLEISHLEPALSSRYDFFENGQRIHDFARKNYASKEPWPALENPFDPKNKSLIENNFEKPNARAYWKRIKIAIRTWLK